MKRRSFLQLLGLAPMAAACSPVKGEEQPLKPTNDFRIPKEQTVLVTVRNETTHIQRMTVVEWEQLRRKDPSTMYVLVG